MQSNLDPIGGRTEGIGAGARHAGMQESVVWHAAYDSAEQVHRRRKAIPQKLRKLGLNVADLSSVILDLCCGNGETLDALYEMGFRHLHGVDIAVGPELSADPRYSTRQADASAPPFPDGSLDWILIIHALHHLGPATRINSVLEQCHRILKPGGRLAIIDFSNSPQIRLAFWFFRQDFWLVTPYLKYFGRLIQEEWCFLKAYLPQWPEIYELLHGGPFQVEVFKQEFFYYYLTLRKPFGRPGLFEE